MAERFDLVVIGGGPGGYVAAIRSAQLGRSVALVEKRATLGGTCLNVGCIPSKALLDSSEIYAQAKHQLARHGVQVGDVKLDLATMLARKDAVVKSLTQGLAGLMRKNKITVFTGSGRLAEARQGETLRVLVKGAAKEDILEANKVLLAAGSEPVTLPSLSFDGAHIVSSTEALSFERVPQHLIVVGAGYIGLELGSVWARLGAKVTVVEFLPRILPLSDGEIAELLHKSLLKQGLTFHLETRVTGAGTQGGEVVVHANCKGRDLEFKGDRVLVAIGRRPCTTGLGLQEVGVQLEEKTGKIVVGEHFETNVPGIYAIGDLIHGPMLAHKAEEDGMAFAEHLAGMKSHVNHDTVPSVIYTHPEVASVGPTEEEIKSSGKAYKVGRFPFMASARARTMDETEGLVKVIADAQTDRLLAVHIMGPKASELIAEAVTVMEFAGSAEDIARTCHAHPTLSEAVKEAALGVDKRTIHL
jgi:dihydrolipoamide dehydrogenase